MDPGPVGHTSTFLAAALDQSLLVEADKPPWFVGCRGEECGTRTSQVVS